jgi:hypothetical protein
MASRFSDLTDFNKAVLLWHYLMLRHGLDPGIETILFRGDECVTVSLCTNTAPSEKDFCNGEVLKVLDTMAFTRWGSLFSLLGCTKTFME